jgi:hypothetical protein
MGAKRDFKFILAGDEDEAEVRRAARQSLGKIILER